MIIDQRILSMQMMICASSAQVRLYSHHFSGTTVYASSGYVRGREVGESYWAAQVVITFPVLNYVNSNLKLELSRESTPGNLAL